jgi:iron-sulfur cluster assembly accessory protein
MITITEKAVNKIKEFAEAEGLIPQIRAKAKGGHCAGMSFDLEFVDLYSETDEIVCFGDVKLIIDQFSIHYIINTEIDYIDSITETGFRFNNNDPKITSCGCGRSFQY